jgi:hypothetical protein
MPQKMGFKALRYDPIECVARWEEVRSSPTTTSQPPWVVVGQRHEMLIDIYMATSRVPTSRNGAVVRQWWNPGEHDVALLHAVDECGIGNPGGRGTNSSMTPAASSKP